MKKIIFLTIIVGFVSFFSCNDDPYGNIKKYVTSETVYPEKFDTISAAVGFERVEIYLTKGLRSDSVVLRPNKAITTVVQYDDTTIMFEGMKHWVNIEGLAKPKLYRFYVYTLDEFGNKSVPQTIAKIPFTREDRDAIRISDPKTILSPWGASLSWPNGISTSMWNFVGCDYNFKDRNGQNVQDTMNVATLRFDATNLSPGSVAAIDFTISVLPIVDGKPILDTVRFSQNIAVEIPGIEEYAAFLKSREIEKWENDGTQMIIRWKPVADYTLINTTVTYTDYTNTFAPVERTVIVNNNTVQTPMPGLCFERFNISSAYEPVGGEGVIVNASPTFALPEFIESTILGSNGITRQTDSKTVTKLVYPVNAGSLMDLLYFPNLTEIDLTGDGINVPSQNIVDNNVSSVVGGCPWNPSLLRIDWLSNTSIRNFVGQQALSSKLTSGKITKVRYMANTMGLDAMLSGFIASGVAEILPTPAEVLMSNSFFADGNIVSGDWRTEFTYQPNDTPVPIPGGATNVWKIIPQGASASFCFVYPKEYKFNIWEYRYLKMKVHAPDASYFPTDYYGNFKRIWFRLRNHLWGRTPTPSWDNDGTEYNAGRDEFKIPDAELGTWKDITFDIWSIADRTSHPYQNVLVINIGGEPGGTFAPPRPITYYFADIRFSKTP